MRNTFLVILLFISLSLFAVSCGIVRFSDVGPLPKVISSDIHEFYLMSVDTLLIYNSISYGTLWKADSNCLYKNPNNVYFFFWIKNGRNFISMRDDCYAYERLMVDSGPFNYLYQIKDTMLKERYASTGYFEPHYSRVEIILLDDYNDFRLDDFGGTYYGRADSVAYNKSLLKSKFKEQIEAYINVYKPILFKTRKLKKYVD